MSKNSDSIPPDQEYPVGTAKKPQDATLRNVRAANKRLDKLEKEVKAMAKVVKAIKEYVDGNPDIS